jgi:glycosyltransferase involved in cell wall biosynthesis
MSISRQLLHRTSGEDWSTSEDRVGATKVSVVVPSHRRIKPLGEAVQSALAQTHENLDITIVLSAATDGVKAEAARLAQENDRVRVVTAPTPGIAIARNTGIRSSTGEWIAILDDDDVWYPDKLRTRECPRLDPSFSMAISLCTIASRKRPASPDCSKFSSCAVPSTRCAGSTASFRAPTNLQGRSGRSSAYSPEPVEKDRDRDAKINAIRRCERFPFLSVDPSRPRQAAQQTVHARPSATSDERQASQRRVKILITKGYF